MRSLDVYKERQATSLKLGDKTFRIPNEYTVEEVERLLELQIKREAVEEEKVSPANEASQLKRFWAIVFDQLEILFQHYQPEITGDELKTLLTRKEALDILGFYDKYRQHGKSAGGKQDPKKKILG